MRRPGHEMLQGITLQKGGLFNVEANEWSEARKNLHPQHLLHYYNRYVSKIQDAAIYNPLNFLFVAEGGFCQHDDLRSILTRDWTPEQLATVGEGVAAVHRAATVAAAAPASHHQPVTLDVAAVMARLDAAAAAAAAREQEEGELEELLPPASVPDAVPAVAVAVAVATFTTSEAGKKLLDSCGGFEALRPVVCAHLDPACVQTNVISLDGDVHWVTVTPKGAAIWDELRTIQRHMNALRELCK